jgi:S1-C subfamily serine protease
VKAVRTIVGDAKPKRGVGTLRAVSGGEADDSAGERDEGSSAPRPDPLDRPWVHPSELRSYVANPLPPMQARPREWVIGLVSAGAGAAAAVLVLLAFGVLGERNRSPIPPAAIIPKDAAIDYQRAAQVNLAAGPSIVTVRATAGDITTVGSGVAVSSNRVLTTAHLLIGAGTIMVFTSDGRQYPAETMGLDADTDLSLLKVSGSNLSYRPFADAPPDIGEPVIAVAITKGSSSSFLDISVVSRLNRMVTTTVGTTMAGLLQANLSTTLETSGGALFDKNAQLVGILVTPPGVTDLGLAVPIDVADDVRQQIEASGKVAHGWLGLTAEDAADRPGAKVTAVAPDSPAANAKLEVGDVIIAAGGHNVGNLADLTAEWRRRRPADSLGIDYRRGRDRHSTTATLTAGPAPDASPPDAGNN